MGSRRLMNLLLILCIMNAVFSERLKFKSKFGQRVVNSMTLARFSRCVSRIDCAKSCAQLYNTMPSNSCHSFNFNPTSQVCELIGVEGGDLVEDDSWQHGNIVINRLCEDEIVSYPLDGTDQGITVSQSAHFIDGYLSFPKTADGYAVIDELSSTPNNNFSVVLSIFPQGSPEAKQVLVADWTQGHHVFTLHIYNNVTLVFTCYRSVTPQLVFSGAIQGLQLNTWYAVGATWDVHNMQASIYVNDRGYSFDIPAQHELQPPSGTIQIGYSADTSTEHFFGRMKNFAFCRHVLSHQEVLGLARDGYYCAK